MVGGLDACAHVWDRAVRFAAEAEQDRLDDRGVVVEHVCCLPWCNPGRDDEGGDGGEGAGGGVLEEAARSERFLSVEVGGDAEVADGVEGVDHPEHWYVVVGVPAPGDAGVVEVTDERLQVVDRWFDVVAAALGA